ncbi:hypothetical protein B0I35DRAFT_492482 [Stachybotrys elegans]|uniref:Protein kinase domain-containing protein n=1 Tax=Stachybotrys elegans TaxID=80388 RepID=A0A8K0SH71_9HYPO|nr:hypothetical protein B0I35DRAFT_492482 [Stachybotrys elegans]
MNPTDHWGIAIKEAANLEQIAILPTAGKHLITPIAAYSINSQRCLMFPWAAGGHLARYWKEYKPQKALEREDARWIFEQLSGLCSAILYLHEHNCRHGDLKPENILWFTSPGNRGTLQIADLGLATFHEKEESTDVRLNNDIHTATPSGTPRYEPPEEEELKKKPGSRSRAYDIWSLGCTILELLIWLCYGYNNLKIFRENTKRYFWTRISAREMEYALDPEVVRWMNALKTKTTATTPCSAYSELLNIVTTEMLVIPVKRTPQVSIHPRATAEEVSKMIELIYERCSDPSYISDEALKRSHPFLGGHVYEEGGSLAEPPRSDSSLLVLAHSHGHHLLKSKQQSKGLNNDWEPAPEDGSAARIIDRLGWEHIKPPRKEQNVCQAHHEITNGSSRLFQAQLLRSQLEARSQECDLCGLLFMAIKQLNIGSRIVDLRETVNSVGLLHGPDLLSVYVEPGQRGPVTGQLGLPILPEPGSLEQLTLLKEWLKICDSTHSSCCPQDEEKLATPTRLIRVTEPMRLVMCNENETYKYVVLSHCWGSTEKGEVFKTTKANIEKLQTSISIDVLPRTFRDAITLARKLDIEYIWIDSVCIIQEDLVEWESEARKMGDVFSAAYCTITASSAETSSAGFLTHRDPRSCVQIDTADRGTLYVCRAIDDFPQDVEISVLNSRGWVLQERALSRRSIHYTSTQIYWECSSGVYCETLAHIQNSKAAFLGDSNFPSTALAYYRDGRQILIQDLYERYSTLAFTRWSDRAVAILGLQKRLARAFKSQAAYGFFAIYFPRGLLWRSGHIRGMRRIQQPEGRYVPTWSWLSKEGPIRYMDLEFEQINWAKEEFISPFDQKQVTDADKPSISKPDRTVLWGLARRLRIPRVEMKPIIHLDTEEDVDLDELRCVIIGRDKRQHADENIQVHALIISTFGITSEPLTYFRAGVASLKEKDIEDGGSWVEIR